jgi:hypothetical protein
MHSMHGSRTMRVACLLALLLLGVVAGGNEAAHRLPGTGTTTAPTQLRTTAAWKMGGGEEVHRRILASINPSGLDPDKPSCLKSCPARGQPYTNRGCQRAYRCG